MRTATALSLFAAVLVFGLCASTEAAVHDITVGNNFFSPIGTVAAVGDTVRWTWVGGIPHSTTSDPSSTKFWDSGISSAGGFTFQIEISPTDGPGPFPYHCNVHPGMQDTIFVAPTSTDVVIPPGVDLWVTPESRDREFETNPIPADFFNPGCDPFFGTIEFTGAPVQTDPPGAFGPADLIIHRLDTATLADDGATQTVPIEIVAMNLQSVEPITVTYNTGQVERWQVQLACSSTDPALSSMELLRECNDGGAMTFDITFQPTYIFTRVFPPATSSPLTYEPPAPTQLSLDIGSHWSTVPTTMFDLPTSDGSVTVDHDLNPSSPNIAVPASTDGFFNGLRNLSAAPCDGPDCQGLSFGRTKDKPTPSLPPSIGMTTLSIETGPAVFAGPPIGAACLTDGSCVLTTSSCAAAIGATYAGDGTRCSDNPCGSTVCFESLADIHLNTTPSFDPIAACGDAVTSWTWDVGGSNGSLSFPTEPVSPGIEVPIEIVQLELSGLDPIFGPIVLRTRETRPSRGFITVLETDVDGNISCGDMFVEMFWEIELVDSGLVLTTGDRPIRVQTPFDGSVPIPADFFGPTDGSPVQIFVEGAPAHFGWICGANFKPHNVVTDCLPVTGACCLPGGGCTDGVSRIECLALNGIYAGDNSSCLTATCPADWRTDTLHATGEIRFDLPPLGFEPELLPGFPPPEPLLPGVCINPGPIIIRTPEGPYTPGDQIQTEIVEMNLHGTHPTLGPFVLSEDPDFTSQGSSTIDSVDSDGTAYLVDSFFDIYVRIAFEDTALEVHTGPTPIYLSGPGQSEPIPIEDISLSTDECDNPVGHLVNRVRAIGTGRTTGHIADLLIDIKKGTYKPNEGITFQQVDFAFENHSQPNSDWGRMEVDVLNTLSLAGLDSGFVNVYTNVGWVVQNLWLSSTDSVLNVATYFQLNCESGIDVSAMLARIGVTETPIELFGDSTRDSYPVSDWTYNAEGRETLTSIGFGRPPTALPLSWGITDPSEAHTQPNKSNVQTADDQCFPMSIANSLQYLEDRYGLPVPHHHGVGLKGDTTLVGQLGDAAGRNVNSRSDGDPVADNEMLDGKFKYLADNALERKLVLKHQGGYIPAGDYSSSGITSKDESGPGQTVTFEWICNELKKGEDVELCWTYYDSLGNPDGGHAIRAFECGNTWGIPWIGYAHDAQQTSDDATDSEGLECVREWFLDLDGDGQPNMGSLDREVDFAISESADTDMDGITNELDNSPDWYNPGQEDLDGNGIGDVEETSIRGDETIASFDLSAGTPHVTGPFTNELPPNPDHKDLWFVGNATNPSSSDTVQIVVSFVHGTDSTTLKDTTRILPDQTREIFGSALLDYCPEQVSVLFTPVDGAVSDISGTFHHLCYGLPSDNCCIGTTGNVNNDPGQMVTLTDLTLLVNHLFVTFEPIPCPAEANTNGDTACAVNLSDLTVLVNSLFVTFDPTAPCNPLCE